MAIPARVRQRVTENLKRFRGILEEAKNRDVNEADTVTIVKAMLSELLGWDPFFEVTAEYRIRSTYVDLAVRDIHGIRYLVEVKAIGTDLRELHIRQAVDYAANQGIDWAVLTNSVQWQIRRVMFGKPITQELVFELDFLSDNARSAEFLDRLFLLTKEGMTKAAIDHFHSERQAMSRFNLAAIIQSEPVLKVIRRELRRAYPDVNPAAEQLLEILLTEVLKRDVVQGDKAQEASKTIRRATRALRRSSRPDQDEVGDQAPEPIESSAIPPSEIR